MNNEEENEMKVANKEVIRSNSEAFRKIRGMFQEQMKKEGFVYNKETQQVEKKTDA